MFKKTKIILLFIVAITFIAFFLFNQNNKNLKVTFFDVGQGDSSLIQTPFGQDILIDGGPDNGVLKNLGYDLGFFNNDIELMILTHPHEDHISGLIEVLRRYDVEKIIYTGINYDSLVYKAFLEEVSKEDGVEILIIDKKQRIILGDSLYLDILYPDSDITKEKEENVNNTSVIARLVYGENSFLFMGDAEIEEEMKIVDDGGIQSDVLKVAHHGSKTNDSEFLNIVSPEYAIISVGEDNKFGHPNVGVLNMLENINSEIIRTDKAGDITFWSDGHKLSLKN